MDTLQWSAVETYGDIIPTGRQGHAMVLEEQNLILMGGCDYKIKKCYKETFYLDTTTLYWTRLTEDRYLDVNIF